VSGGGRPSGQEPAESGGYWSDVWRQLRKNRGGMGGLLIATGLLLMALLAPLIANDRPIVCRYAGNTSFPAVVTYVDTWVPWQSLRFELKSLKVAGTFPLGDHYPELEGQTWKEVAESEQMGFALWPPIPWHPNQFDKDAIKERPSGAHLLGTDDQGRDVLARMIHGTVVAMLVGIISMSIAAGIGITLGLMAGFLGGWTDILLSRLVEVVICFPTFFLIIAVIAFLEPSIVNIMIVLGCVGWTGIFRLVRGEVLAVRNLDYVQAARSLGISNRRIMFRHVLPNAVSPVFVAIAFGIAGAVLTETSLSFLGFGDPTAPSWGEIVKQGRTYVSQGLWHLTVFPGIAIFLTLTAFNLFGQGLRDAMDPKLRGQ
jgi:peptide/nickel transport system permease protein